MARAGDYSKSREAVYADAFKKARKESILKEIDNCFERKLRDCRTRRKAAILRISRMVQQEG